MRALRRYRAAGRLMILALVATVTCGLATAMAAADEPPPLLWQAPEDGVPGAGAGRITHGRGVAADPATGHVFVSDLSHRIDEFTAWGEFVKAWGFGVEDGSPELQVCTAETGCQKGIAGDAAGQLDQPLGLAIDSTGSVYVFERGNSRVTKFDQDGNFLLTFGGDVDETTGADVCTQSDVEAGDQCGGGVSGTGPGFFHTGSVGNFLSVGPDDTVYVGDENRIEEFNPDGSFKSQLTFTGPLAALAGFSIKQLTVGDNGDIYVSSDNLEPHIYLIPASRDAVIPIEDTVTVAGEEKHFPVNPTSLDVDPSGNLFVVDHGPQIANRLPFEVIEFGPEGECVRCGTGFPQFSFGPDTEEPLYNGLALSQACGVDENMLYLTARTLDSSRSALLSFGPSPRDAVACPPPQRAPEIVDQGATSVGTEQAVVQARINPQFWTDTTYYVQYGPQACLDSGWTAGCTSRPLAPGDLLTDKVLRQPLATEKVDLEGLEPGTAYYYRFVAQSSGGGPVYGVGGTESAEGQSSSFHTFPEPLTARVNCPNQAFRTEASALLPDCRAFEMVSPVDKNGGDITTQKSIQEYPAGLDLVSVDGESVTYSSSTAFANAQSSPYASQYIARRDPAQGWLTEAISPPREQLLRPAGRAPLYELDLQYKHFTPDLSQAWLMQEADPPLDPCAVPGFINWYLRDNLTGAYEAITTGAPQSNGPLWYFPEVLGASADGSRVIFRANDKLPTDEGPEAANLVGDQLYEHVAQPGGCGVTRLVSVLPDGTANPTSSFVGTGATGNGSGIIYIESRENLVHNAVSNDGSRVYWTAADSGPGKIYLRVDGTETLPVSSGKARFWFASSDGSVAYYTEDGTLKVFDVESGSSQIAGGVIGLLGASEDGSRAYFVSTEDLGGGAVAGKPNLYLYEGGAVTYVTTLSASDVSPALEIQPASQYPAFRDSSLTEDGRFLAFISDASLTGGENIDAVNGSPNTEAYLYEADTGELHCLSCPLTRARSEGRIEDGFAGAQRSVSSRIPPWKNQFHAPRVISADGSRVYFETLGRLVPRDVDGKQDVYAWTRASDDAECEAISAELYSPASEGCISLIGSGTDAEDSEFVDSTPSGSDALIRTSASLVSQDPGHVDLYDARVGGGFPPPTGCPDSEGCPPPPVPPGPPAGPPAPGSTGGTGNPDLAPCAALQRRAHGFARKAGALRAAARKARGAKATKLKSKAKRMGKKAHRAGARANACYSGTKGP